MSGIVAAAQSSGCCCRPQEGCLCTDLNRPGAVTDRGLTSISVSCDISYAHEFRYNGGSLIGFCGVPCSCRAVNNSTGTDWPVAQPYGYRLLGNRVYQDLDEKCKGCTTTSCPSCPPYSVNGSLSGSILSRITLQGTQGLGYEFRKLSTGSVLDQSIGSWNWTPQQVGTCVDPFSFPWRMRAFCNNGLYALGGGIQGILPAISVDPNGAYIRNDNGEYSQGRWGNNIGAIYVMYSLVIIPPRAQDAPGDLCAYRAEVTLSFMSFANIRDTFADCGGSQFPIDIPSANGFTCGGSPVASWRYSKPCTSPTDTVFGTYTLIDPADIENYSQAPEDRCGRTQFYNDSRANAGETLAVS